MTTTKLKGCIRCGGALNLTQDEPFCIQCGWVSWDDETHEVRRTATKRKRTRSGSGQGYRLPNRARTGPHAGDSLTVLGGGNTADGEQPLCPTCLVRMKVTWSRKTPPGSKAYSCTLGHTVVVYRNRLGESVSWTWFTTWRHQARQGI